MSGPAAADATSSRSSESDAPPAAPTRRPATTTSISVPEPSAPATTPVRIEQIEQVDQFEPVASTDGWPLPATNDGDIVLVGDSLAQEISPVLQYLDAGRTVVPKFWGGTAPCDWLEVDLEADRSSVVVITFTGNSLTPCMEDGSGGHLHDQALVDRYRDDIGALVERARQAGARVVLVGQPYRSAAFDDDLEVDGLNAAYEAYADALPFVSFVDAGAAVEDRDGRYTDRLPCAEFDVGCESNGTVIVRGDGVHFCPIAGENPCSVPSSGAIRFALAIADAAADPARYDVPIPPRARTRGPR